MIYKKKSIDTVDLVLVSLFAALMAIGANVTSFLVIGSVPVTMQTLFSILAGALLGRRLGAFSMIIYLLIGFVGFPVFAQFKGGLAQFVQPTLGFLFAFIAVAYITGAIIDKSEKKGLLVFTLASFSGLITTYVIGVNYMYLSLKFLANLESVSYKIVLSWMIAPFIKDFILTILAAIIAKRIYHIIHRAKRTNSKNAA